jgi:dipeptidyl aminopeptidase/acylaminoacyl peptidase
VRVPFLILQGSLDKTVPPESSELFKQVFDKNKVPNERHVFEGVGHNVPTERASEVNRLMQGWFKKNGVLKTQSP